MIVLKVFVGAMAGLGLLFLLAVLIGKCIAVGNRAYGRHGYTQLGNTVPAGDRYTVVWHENRYEMACFTGRLEWLDFDTLLIDDGNKTVMVARRDIEEMF